MNYQVRRQGQDLGVFSLEELRLRRESGELSGNDYVRSGEKSDWQPLDMVLLHGYQVSPPPLPASASNKSAQPVIWLLVVLGVVGMCVFFGFFFYQVRRGVLAKTQIRTAVSTNPDARAAADEPIVWTTNTLTEADVTKTAKAFRVRQWLTGYNERGQRNPECDEAVNRFLETWLANNYGGEQATNADALGKMCESLAADANCTDAIALTMLANETQNQADVVGRFDRALAAFAGSKHRAYPQFCANMWLARNLGSKSPRIAALDAAALEQLQKCFGDGSFTPADQQIVADIFINGWGYNFFYRQAAAVCQIARNAGPDYAWLALVLDGENNISAAWRARGGGYADSVTENGWQGFHSHLAAARKSLTEAWDLQPTFPLAPCRMVYVALGDSDITEMRTWFDRTTTAQIDYSRAWKDLRWGLRPRWYGSTDALLALGKIAVSTGRFDTDVPRKFIDCVYDVESEMNLPAGRHIFGRADIWAEISKIYEGYIAAPSQSKYQAGWRSSYAVIASIAGKYDLARQQLEILNWKPQPSILAEWRLDPALWPLEIAARTGPLGEKITAIETIAKSGHTTEALKQYKDLSLNSGSDARTTEFVYRRIASLETGGTQPKL